MLKVETQEKIANVEEKLADKPNSKAGKKRLEILRSLLAKIEAELENHPGKARF